MKLNTAQRKALAICGGRLPICDLGKDRYRSLMYDLTRTHPHLVRLDAHEGRWILSPEGAKNMGRASWGCTWVKWAKRHGQEATMVKALNEGGTEAGHAIIRSWTEEKV